VYNYAYKSNLNQGSMVNLTLYEDNTELKTMIPLLSSDKTSHFNLIFYDTCSTEGDYNRHYPVNPHDNPTKILPTADFRTVDFNNLTEGRKNLAVGLSSLVRLQDGRFRHMKQLDIDTQFSVSSFLKSVSDITAGMKGSYSVGSCGGYLVNSGSGYHYYEKGLLNQSQWEEWMENAKKSGLIDKKWIMLSQQREYSVLRLNSTTQKPFTPVVLCKFSLE